MRLNLAAKPVDALVVGSGHHKALLGLSELVPSVVLGLLIDDAVAAVVHLVAPINSSHRRHLARPVKGLLELGKDANATINSPWLLIDQVF